MTCHIKVFKAQRGAVTPGKNPEHQSCDSIKVTLLEEKKINKEKNPSPSPLCSKVLCDSGW